MNFFEVSSFFQEIQILGVGIGNLGNVYDERRKDTPSEEENGCSRLSGLARDGSLRQLGRESDEN